MREHVRISAVIPTYNRSHLVGRAIESVLAQEYSPAEIIVVDDGSLDGTREILESYGEKLRWVYQANAGVSAARNRGVKEAKCKWIAFLDSDDFWLPGHLAHIVTAIHATQGEAALYFSNLKNSCEEEGFHYWSRCRFEIEGDWEFKRDAGDWAFLQIQPMMVQASVVSRKAFEEIGGFSEQLRTSEDTLFFFKICLLYPACAVLGVGTVLNLDDNNRLTQLNNNYSFVYNQANIFLYKELLASFKDIDHERRKFFIGALASSYLGVGRVFWRKRTYLRGVRYLALSCRASPLVLWKEFRGFLAQYFTKKVSVTGASKADRRREIR